MSEKAIRRTTQPPAPLEECLRTRIEWQPTDEAMEPWRSQVGRNLWTLHVNDFPEEHLYTLSINGRAVGDFDDWPPEWVKVDSEKRLFDDQSESPLGKGVCEAVIGGPFPGRHRLLGLFLLGAVGQASLPGRAVWKA